MRIVQKYGGTSLASLELIRKAAQRAATLQDQGHQVVMVVSAQGHTTDEMIHKAKEVNRHIPSREMDAFLSAGEQMSAALMAMALKNLRKSAVSLTGWQAGIHTDDIHADARILSVDTKRIEKELTEGKIPVVTGFQGIGPSGDVTTLGRGGSDTTAVALAAWLKADQCQIFTDVEGIYDRDPRQWPDAWKFERIGYRDMLALIREGAQVLHGRSVELAMEWRVALEVRSAFCDTKGTVVE